MLPLQGAADDAPPCPGFQFVEAQGWSCPVPGGWEVLLDDGTRLLTHGPDAAPASDAPSFAPAYASPPVCLPNGTTSHHNLLIYAVPADRADQYPSIVPTLRDLVAAANGHLLQEAALFGHSASYKFACDPNGAVTVVHARLPTTTASDSFSTIVNDLRAQGYGLGHVKHWVYYDGFFGGIGGQGHVNNDDRNIVSNANNNGGQFAITYGYLSWQIMMHESGHNMGAVQLTAPDTSGGWHCNDGWDIMCYSDGGSNSSYNGGVCSGREYFDCDHDSYFHPDPPPGSYLATHWNLASPLNRFIDLSNRPPTTPLIVCPSPSGVNKTVTCSFAAYDESRVHFEVEWGDGTSQRVPATGSAASGEMVRVSHTWTEMGSKLVRARATDDESPPLSSAWASLPVSITCGFQRSNHVLVGLNGHEIQNVSFRRESGIDPSCWGRPYKLDHPAFSAYRVCWEDAARADLGCGDVTGTVPTGAASVRLVLLSGFDAAYLVRIV